MSEHLPRNTALVEGSSNRSFGLVFTIFFLIVSLLPMLSGQKFRVWGLSVTAVFLVLALIKPDVLAPLNHMWTKLGMLLHHIVSPVALGIIFFLVLTPIGLMIRVLGKDVLRLTFDKTAHSYWIDRTPPGPTSESLKNQF